MSGQVNLDQILRGLSCYRNVSRIKVDVIACMSQVRTLIPKVKRLIHNNGMESELLVLDGTIKIQYQGREYNIPVDIYISEPYPDAPPRCYVRPTTNMEIKMGHRHVDREGLVYLPYLHEWNARTHNLLELCAHMSSVFGTEPPVFASRKPQQAQPTSSFPGAAYQQPARPPGPQASGTPYYYGAGANGSQPPPPSYDSLGRPPQATQFGGAYGATPYNPAQQQPQLSAAQQQAQAEMRRKEAVQQVTLRLQRALTDFTGKVKSELTEEQDKGVKLEENGQQIIASLAQLKGLRDQLQTQVSEMSERDKKLDGWLAEQTDKAQATSIEDRFEAGDPPSKQMLKLVAENAAIEDALYHLDRAIANGSTDCVSFLREVRRLARDQFMCLAHVNKIYRQQQAYYLAQRQAPVGGTAPQTGAYANAPR